MKKLLLFLIFTDVVGFSQQKVFEKDIFYQTILDEKKLLLKYPPLQLIRKERKQVNEQKFINQQRIVAEDFRFFASSKGVKLHEFQKKQTFFFKIYAQCDGEIDYVLYGFTVKYNDQILEEYQVDKNSEKVLEGLMVDFFKNYKLAENIFDSGYELTISNSLGKDIKKPSKYFISNIEQAEKCNKPDTVKQLRLNKLYLERFPDVVFRFKNLEKLDLSDNLLTTFPKEIWELKKLKFLSLSGNNLDEQKINFRRNKHLKDLNLQYAGLETIPKSVRKNKRLEILFIGNNQIQTIRNDDFRGLRRLKVLNFYNNRISELPKTISKLKNLQELDMYHNNLRYLPNEICKQKNLKTLAVSNNNLWNLPENLSNLKNLKILYAHHNKLNDLPNLPNLELLDIGYNLFKEVPKSVFSIETLTELDCSNNEISVIPRGLLKLQNLKTTYIRGNEFSKNAEKEEDYDLLVEELEKKNVVVR